LHKPGSQLETEIIKFREVVLVRAEEEGRTRVIQLTNAALQRKAKDLTILKVKELSSFTDYFIICSGTSDRQVRAIADSIETGMKKLGVLPLGIEGRQAGEWILIDYSHVVVHIFNQPVREFYDIERLWADAPIMKVEESVQSITSLNDDI